MNKLQLSANSNLNLFLQCKSNDMLLNTPAFVLEQLFGHIHNSYDILPESDKITVISINGINDSEYDNDYLRPILKIKEIAENLKDDIVAILLHGSMATHNYVKGWSDVDILCVIKSSSINQLYKKRSEFIKMEEQLYLIDKLQHHGIQFITDKDLSYYTNVYYPIHLINETKSILGDITLTVKSRSSECEQSSNFYSIYNMIRNAKEKGIMYHHGYDGEYLETNYRNTNTMYQLKYFLSVLSLLPVLFMNLAGIYCSKQLSFTAAKIFISEENWKIILKAEKIRSLWDTFPVIDNEIPQYIKDILGCNYFEEGFNFVEELRQRYEKANFVLIKDYITQMVRFCTDNPNLNVMLVGTVTEPGMSDLDLMVLDEVAYIDESVRKYFKPLNNYGGDVLICPTEIYSKLPYIIDLNLTSLQGTFPSVEILTLKEMEYFYVTDIIEWLPERLLLARHILKERTYDTDKLYLLIKSIKRSISTITRLIDIELVLYDDPVSFELLEKYHNLGMKYYKIFETYNPYISGYANGSINISSYYKSENNEFNALKLYLYYISSIPSNASSALQKCLNIKVNNFTIDKNYACFISKRWSIIDYHYNWFKNRDMIKGMIKWGWLLH